MRRPRLALLNTRLVVAGLLATLGACCPTTLYELLAPLPAVRLPLDEAPHPCGGTEWWYYSGRVTTAAGRDYGLHAVIFHTPRLPNVGVGDAWIAHYAVLDVQTGAFAYDQVRVLDPGVGADAGACGGSGRSATADGELLPSAEFDLCTPLVQMTGGHGADWLRAAMGSGDFALDIALHDVRGPVLHGREGYAPHGAGGRAFYYSRPRMRATGTLAVEGVAEPISGELWFDRQWGLDITDPGLPWDWFSLRLDDGADVMLYVYRDAQPPVAFGTVLPPEGAPWPLDDADFAITPTAWWTSPHTGITYPVQWQIAIPPAELALTVTAVAADQELDVRATTVNIYWEGLCTVVGTRAAQPAAGFAFVELANAGDAAAGSP